MKTFETEIYIQANIQPVGRSCTSIKPGWHEFILIKLIKFTLSAYMLDTKNTKIKKKKNLFTQGDGQIISTKCTGRKE